MECYSKAAKQSHARSAYNLAVLLLKSESGSVPSDQLREVTRLLELAASLGLREVCVVLCISTYLLTYLLFM